MRALVTGGAGFIGSHLCESLIADGYVVDVVDDLSTGRKENIASLIARGQLIFHHRTMNDEELIERLVEQSDVIYHLGAAVGVRLVYERPVHTIETNIVGTQVILHAAAKYKKKILIASTSEVYGKGNKIPFSEEDDLLLGSTSFPRWSYACSKQIDEFLALAYYKEQGLPVVITRFFNTVGPRQIGNYGMVIPCFIEMALKNEPLVVHGDGSQSRCFIHVHDTVRAVRGLMGSEDTLGRVYNVGSTDEITILELANKVIEATNSQSEVEFISYEKAYGPDFEDLGRRVPDLTRLRGMIDFTPKHSIDGIIGDILKDLYS